jgi:hypothetical protein
MQVLPTVISFTQQSEPSLSIEFLEPYVDTFLIVYTICKIATGRAAISNTVGLDTQEDT